MQKAQRAGRPCYHQQKGPAWLALNHVLKRMRVGAMALLLEDLPQLILLATDYSCSLDQQTNWAAVECLHTFLETLQEMVWKFASCSPTAVLDRLKSVAAPLRSMKLLTALVKVMKPLAASVAGLQGERDLLWPRVLCFLLHDTLNLSKPAGQLSLTSISEQTAIGVLNACHDAGYPTTCHVHIYGPTLIRLAKTHCSSPSHSPAVRFLCKVLTDDAAVLHEVNISPAVGCHALPSHHSDWLCSPALWKDCGHIPDLDPQVYSAIIRSAALLCRTRGSQAASSGPAGAGAGFHSVSGFQSSPFYSAMEWPQSWDPSSQQSHSAVRALDYPALLLEHQIPPHLQTLAEGSWCLVLTVMQEGLSIASVNAAQCALRAEFQLLPSIWALVSGRRSSSSGTISEDVLMALGDMSWLVTALLWGLQCPEALSKVWVSSLCQVLDMLPKPINAVLPEECLEVARRVLAPSSCLSDNAKLRLAPHFSAVAPGNIGREPLQDWPSRLAVVTKPSQVAHGRSLTSPQKQKSSADGRAKTPPLSKLKAAISKMDRSGAPATDAPPKFKRPTVRTSASQSVSSKSAAKQSASNPGEPGRSNRPLAITPDRDLDAELDRKKSSEQQEERSKLGLPLASKPQRKMIQIAAPPDSNMWARRRSEAVQKAATTKEELRANLKQAMEASQHRSSDHILQLCSLQRQSEMHVAEFLMEASSVEQPFRSSDVLLLTSTSKGAGRHDAVQLLILVESVERDPTSRDQQTVQALVNMTPKDSGITQQDLHTIFLPRTKWQAKQLLSCVPHLRQFQALCKAAQFPPALLHFLLQPQQRSGRVSPALTRSGLPSGLQSALQRQHNPSQQAAIAAALDKQKGLISLIQGPPGTGKTSTIVSVVSSFLNSAGGAPSEQPGSLTHLSACRVLVCAQSNAAVDELALRLSKGVLDGSGNARSASVVRLGVLEATSSEVQALHIDTLSGCRADKEKSAVSALDRLTAAKERRLALGRQLTQVRTDLDTEAAGGGAGKDNDEQPGRERTPEEQAVDPGKAKAKLDALHSWRRQLTAELLAAKEEVQASGQQVQQASRAVRASVIKDAETVVCTLSSAGGELLTILATGLQFFDAIIIDEAAQAVEPAALIPLQMLKPDGKVVLVGDPKQLPATVVSRAADKAGLSRSMFERLQQAGVSVSLLAEQYRMHPAISAWPSSYFYAGYLKDAPAVLGNSRSAPFHQTPCFPPLAFFDCREGEECSSSGKGASASVSNPTEVDLACTLFTGMMKDHGKALGSVAVLSSYKAQVKALRSQFERMHGTATMAAVEFATIDGFQGREADVVIFSCVRARASDSGGVGFLVDGRRMNVALTRARQSLWVIGHVSTLQRGSISSKQPSKNHTREPQGGHGISEAGACQAAGSAICWRLE
ncbi:hypothetical protein WJX75_003688 [Coccomyxa subellipsoidea]|uniref:P-loop containing nucleoside triphosphate hydrolase protein n=1 Tax=Coccomyxa subellipsoidea TaxID=248742 RepID=A0ABR2YDT3_9CHLO